MTTGTWFDEVATQSHRLLFICLLAAPAHAWEFTPGQPCILSHETGEAKIILTYDPYAPLYTLSITRAQAFDPAPVFAMHFDGAAPVRIATDSHTTSRDGHEITVSDRGFGNVLNGLQYNETATAILGTHQTAFDLSGAAEPVAAFRACRNEAGV